MMREAAESEEKAMRGVVAEGVQIVEEDKMEES